MNADDDDDDASMVISYEMTNRPIGLLYVRIMIVVLLRHFSYSLD